MRLRYIIKKVLIAIITLWIIATASFFMLKLLPGTPFSSMQMVGIEMQERLMKYYGLDKPVFEQYLIFLRNTAQGNFGMSYKYLGQSVNDIIKKSFPISLQLGLQAYALSLASGIVLGIISAKKRGSNIDSFFMVVSALFAALPVFVLSSVLQYVFGVKFKLLPLTGWETPTHMILPTISLVFVLFSSKLLTTRTLALEVLNEEYIKTAKAKGLSKYRIFFNYELKNILVPVLSTIGMEITSAMMGSFVVEQIFNIRGIGNYFVLSLQNNDYSLILGITMFFATILILLNLCIDIIISFIDPRIKIYN